MQNLELGNLKSVTYSEPILLSLEPLTLFSLVSDVALVNITSHPIAVLEHDLRHIQTLHVVASQSETYIENTQSVLKVSDSALERE